jgi:hypothetical protein
MLATMIIISHHRSKALAHRHLLALRRKYARADLLSQRNAEGRYSSGGQTFVFEVQEKAEPQIEVVIHFDYGSRDPKGDHLIQFQVHLFAPGTETDKEIIGAIRDHAEGLPYPKGYREKTITWGHAHRRLEGSLFNVAKTAQREGKVVSFRRHTRTSRGRRAKQKRKAAK